MVEDQRRTQSRSPPKHPLSQLEWAYWRFSKSSRSSMWRDRWALGLRDHFRFGSISSSCYALDVDIITWTSETLDYPSPSKLSCNSRPPFNLALSTFLLLRAHQGNSSRAMPRSTHVMPWDLGLIFLHLSHLELTPHLPTLSLSSLSIHPSICLSIHLLIHYPIHYLVSSGPDPYTTMYSTSLGLFLAP